MTEEAFDPRPARSYLYVPGDRPEMLARASTRGADAIIVDLEDAVPVAAKSGARVSVSRWLTTQNGTGPQVWVRLNPESAKEDLSAVVVGGLFGVVIPKAERALVGLVDELLTGLEAERGVGRRLPVLALIETARGLITAESVAAAPRVCHLGIGEVDLLAELRATPSEDHAALTTLRLQVVVASAAAGIGPPVGPTMRDFRDVVALRRSTQALVDLGFRARTAIHPAQLETINEVFTPSAEEVAQARQVVEAYAAAEQDGTGVITGTDGRMVDAAVVRSSREVLERAARVDG